MRLVLFIFSSYQFYNFVIYNNKINRDMIYEGRYYYKLS